MVAIHDLFRASSNYYTEFVNEFNNIKVTDYVRKNVKDCS